MSSCFVITILVLKYLFIQNTGISVVKVKLTAKTPTIETEVRNIIIAKPLTNKTEATQRETKYLLENN